MIALTMDVDDNTAESYESLMQFLYQAPIGLVRTGLDGTIDILNPKSASLLMPLRPAGDLENLFDVLEPVAPDLKRLAESFDAASGVILEGRRVEMPAMGGSRSAPGVMALSLLKLGGKQLLASLHDVTLEVQREQQSLARRLDDAARTDPLTRMPNRAALHDMLARLLAGDHGDGAFAVLYMNCDRFKSINDNLGHAVGDEILTAMAERLRAALRSYDMVERPGQGDGRMAARIGGDEFVVLLSRLHHADDALLVAQRLSDVLAQPYSLGAGQVHCSVSMGVLLAAQAQAEGDADGALQDASIAMVEAKGAGGNRLVVFKPEMRIRAARRGAIEADLRRAVSERQLFVVFQPVVGLRADGRPDRGAAVEALVRWRHPDKGVVPPIEFIPVAEETGLIDAIGSFVLEESCRQYMAWQAEFGERAPRKLAVNLSRAQLKRAGLIDEVHEVLAATGMPPGALQLEVTESLAAQDAAVLSQLAALKALGVSLALDDFGTGYSSLSSLHQMPVDTVKIDRSFVCQADTSAHHRVLIEATVRVAASLGMNTVAEGVETTAQADVVTSLGCDKGQGYLFSRPLEAEGMRRWLEQDWA